MWGWATTGLWLRQALALLLPPYTWLMDVSELVTAWRHAGHPGLRVNLCMGGGGHSPGPREQRHLSRLGGLQHPRLEAGCLLEDELLQLLLG